MCAHASVYVLHMHGCVFMVVWRKKHYVIVYAWAQLVIVMRLPWLCAPECWSAPPNNGGYLHAHAFVWIFGTTCGYAGCRLEQSYLPKCLHPGALALGVHLSLIDVGTAPLPLFYFTLLFPSVVSAALQLQLHTNLCALAAGNIRRAEHFITFMRRLITYMRERLGGARQVCMWWGWGLRCMHLVGV